MFPSVLVANRGEIARRIISTARRLGVRAVAVYSEADADLPFVAEADEAVLLGPPPPAASYLDVAAIIGAARATGTQAIHPGYGFLSESAEFATAVRDAGLIWIGPSPDAMAQMADKINARNLMHQAGVPVLPGTREPVADLDAALAAAGKLGYPVMIKAAAGGGGIGMSAAADAEQLAAGFATARTRADRFFANPAILLERFVSSARHVEVQILGLADGRVLALGERDCSVQRRHQKVAEETPSPALSPQLRERMFAAATQAGRAVGYTGAGTVEFLLDVGSGEFSFLEMNTRLQVEHPVTELVTGIDLVEQQFLVAAEESPSFGQPPEAAASQGGRPPWTPRSVGHAIELRVYAEDPVRFLPSPGLIERWSVPSGPGVRVDAGYREGNRVTPYYDPLLAKLCVHGADRTEALDRAARAVAEFSVSGLKTNLPFHAELLTSEDFRSGDYDTSLVSRLRPGPQR